MKLTNNEKIITTLALEVRRDYWVKVAREHIEYLREYGLDITGNENLDYFVNCVNECTRIIAKIRNSYVSIYQEEL